MISLVSLAPCCVHLRTDSKIRIFFKLLHTFDAFEYLCSHGMWTEVHSMLPHKNSMCLLMFEPSRSVTTTSTRPVRTHDGIPWDFCLCVCFLVSTPMKATRCLMGISWRAVSFTWLWEERSLRGCPTVTYSSPNPEGRGGSMGTHWLAL